MADDLRADLIRHFLAEAEAATRRREWGEVLELAEDVLVLDRDNSDARLLRTLAERHVEVSQPDRGRRHETVVFADLVGSTALANRFDPEFVQRLTLTYERACSPVLARARRPRPPLRRRRHPGQLRLPDLARGRRPARGASGARPGRDRRRHLRRATATSGSSSRSASAWPRASSSTPTGAVARWTQPGDLFGPAVNLAARIHEIAEPGQVCISSDTAALVAGFFELTSLGPHPLKGFDAPIEIHRVLGRTRATGWFDRAGRVASPFLGRVEELGRLRGLWDALGSAGGPDGNVVLITGDPGVGKSRILRELLDTHRRRRPQRRRAPLLGLPGDRARCTRSARPSSATPGSSPTTTTRSASPSWASILEAGGLVVARRCPTWRCSSSSTPASGLRAPNRSPAQVRAVTLRELQRWLTALASASPTMLIVEDIHWADPTTARACSCRWCTAPPPGLLVLMTAAQRAGVARRRRPRHDRPRPAHPRRDPGPRAGGRRDRRASTGRGRDRTTQRRHPAVRRAARRRPGRLRRRRQPAGADPGQPRRAAPGPPRRCRIVEAGGPDRGDGRARVRAGRRRGGRRPASRTRASSTPSTGPCASTSTGSSRATSSSPTRTSPAASASTTPSSARPPTSRSSTGSAPSATRRWRACSWRRASTAEPPTLPSLAYHFDEAGLVVEAVGQYLAAAARGQDIGAYDEVLTHLDRAADLLGDARARPNGRRSSWRCG